MFLHTFCFPINCLIRYLIPEVLERFGQPTIAGAIIADTILNYNDTRGSQEVWGGQTFAFKQKCAKN